MGFPPLAAWGFHLLPESTAPLYPRFTIPLLRRKSARVKQRITVRKNGRQSTTAGAQGIANPAASFLAVFILMALSFSEETSFAGAAGAIHYPDLQTLPPSDIGVEYDHVTGQ